MKAPTIEEIERLISSVLQCVKTDDVLAKDALLRGEQFNVFALCGVDHYETLHSRILAEFLSPNGSHGREHQFLQEFFLKFAPELDLDISLSETRVSTETSQALNGISIGRFDILIENCNLVCIIENKIFASDQPDQLKRYNDWLYQQNQANKILIYLTPDGRESPSGEGVEYTRVAYLKDGDNDICGWLKDCQRHSVEAPFVRETLAQYHKHIQKIIGGSIMKQDVVDVLSKNPLVAQKVYESYVTMCTNLTSSILTDAIKEALRIESVDSGPDYYHKECGFKFRVKPAESEEFVTMFLGFAQTGYTGLYVGVSENGLSDSWRARWRDENDGSELRKRWKEQFEKSLTGGESNEWWPLSLYIGDPSQSWNGEFLQNLGDKEQKSKRIESIREAIVKIVLKLKDFSDCLAKRP